MSKKSSKHTSKQIREAIAYWQNYLTIQEALDEAVKTSASSNKGYILTEAQDDKLELVKSKVAKQLQDPKDLEKFIDDNDTFMSSPKAAKEPALMKAWNILKGLAAAGAKGVKWMLKNWKTVLILAAAVIVWKYGLWKLLGKFIIKAVDAATVGAADILAKILGPEYMKAGVAIDAANQAAGGFGGWTGAGLGGGLR